MSSLESWLSNVTHCVTALGNEPNLGVTAPSDSALSHTIALTGFPGVLPLWTGRRHVVGLLADPRTTPETWPGIIIMDGQGLTLSSDAQTLLPQLILHRTLSGSP